MERPRPRRTSMPMSPFFERFPDVAAEETRTVAVQGDEDLPDGEYGFVELYCDEPRCDCRRVFIEVITPNAADGVLATISFGWEGPQYYRNWANFPLDDEELAEMIGPSVPAFNRQSPFAPALLELAKSRLFSDEEYVARLRRHYTMYRQAVDAERRGGHKPSKRLLARRRKRH
jgi:hypothetical protein